MEEGTVDLLRGAKTPSQAIDGEDGIVCLSAQQQEDPEDGRGTI